jgi:tetratricopeptide (TPR) repeat protein
MQNILRLIVIITFLLSPRSFYPSIDPAGPIYLRILILGDEEFCRDASWATKAELAMNRAAEDFERSFGIILRADEYAETKTPDSLTSLNLLADYLEGRIIKGDHDIAIVFTDQKNLDQSYYGFSLFKEAVIVVRVDQEINRMTKALKHELAHLFGAVHVNDADSLMDLFSRGSRFDSGNAKIIFLNRNRSFFGAAFPLPRENWDETLSLCREIAASLKGFEPNVFGRVGLDRRQNPEDVHLLMAQIYLERQDYKKVISECRIALRINPANQEGLNLWGVALRRSGRIEQAIEKYQEILRRNPDHARVLYNLGLAYSKKGDLEVALSFYQRAIGLKPNFAEAYTNLGDVYLRLGKDAEAEAAFRRAISVGPRFALAYANLAEVFFRQGEYERALTETGKALSIDPRLPEAFNLRGKVFHKRGEIGQAKQEFMKAISQNPQYEKGRNNLGNCYLEEGRIREAEVMFLQAIELNPAFAEAHDGLGCCRLSANRPEEAIREFRTALDLGLKTASLHLSLSSAYLAVKEFDQAMAEAQKALETNPASASAYNNLGIGYLQKGMIDEAIRTFQKAICLDAKNKNALANLGGIYLGLERKAEAMNIYLQALEVDPDNPVIHNNLAVIYFNKGDYAKSWQHAQKAEALGLKLHPDFLRELKKKISWRNTQDDAGQNNSDS